ncbi:hypothetical protein DES53_104482 [Roseimicrobium gellanilyticum]|uniref:Uncharacterized protein n=2 Tax=Roseimicrobium gellanilyticum TaxID=748857 RepID=A0A366HQC1_9BACT|nr:hypothetical protein DES53_104482 [Roseimicrobium gellanilyticum]
MLLTCLPKSFFSGDYRVLGTSVGDAEVQFGACAQPSRICLGQDALAARMHGWLMGRWTLEKEGGGVCVEARQPRLLRRTFELHGEGGDFTLCGLSAFRCRYDLFSGDERVGSIWPAHAFTKRAYIDCDTAVPEYTQLFAFWIAALTWRSAGAAVAT